MKKIQLLDCTLRDGAYIVEGNFGKNAIGGIISQLQEANVDIIEIGWLKNPEYKEGSTYYHTPDDALPFLKNKKNDVIYSAMIDWDRYDLDYLPPYDGRSIDAIRVVFPREKYKEAVKLADPIRSKGYRVFFQAANTLGYTDENLIDMVHAINSVHPESLSVVDTFGAMYEEDLTRIVSIVDHNLNKGIKLGLHSHNNLQQSFSLSMAFIKMFMGSDREIMVDGSLVGMGRGAGNATTELLAGYLNRFCHKDYNLNVIMDAIDIYMTTFISEYEWGYSIPFFLSGTYCAHVNNIAYLKKSHRTTNADIKGVLESMPVDKRLVYDYDLLEKKYVEYKQKEIDDSETISRLRSELAKKQVCLIAPGANASKPFEQMEKVKTSPYIIRIGVNAVVEGYDYDYLFFSNEMRYKYAREAYGDIVNSTKVIITSNILRIDDYSGTEYVVNYNDITKRGWVHFDNSTITCMRLLDKVQVKEVLLVGFDGYKQKSTYSDGLLQSDIDADEKTALNTEIADMLEDFRRTHTDILITFLTESVFCEE